MHCPRPLETSELLMDAWQSPVEPVVELLLHRNSAALPWAVEQTLFGKQGQCWVGVSPPPSPLLMTHTVHTQKQIFQSGSLISQQEEEAGLGAPKSWNWLVGWWTTWFSLWPACSVSPLTGFDYLCSAGDECLTDSCATCYPCHAHCKV